MKVKSLCTPYRHMGKQRNSSTHSPRHQIEMMGLFHAPVTPPLTPTEEETGGLHSWYGEISSLGTICNF
jgi:hypothetical protein